MSGKSFLLIDNNYEDINMYKTKSRLMNFNNRVVHSNLSLDNEILLKSIKQDKIYLVFEEEDFYIKLLKLPKVKTKDLEKVIKNELSFIFNDIKDFMYSYDIYFESKEEIHALVFCINSEKNKIFERLCNKCNIKGIYLIQLLIYDYIIKIKDCSEGILVVMHKDVVYILALYGGKVIFNSIIRAFNANSHELIEKIDYAILRMKEFLRDISSTLKDERVYVLNMEDVYYINVLKSYYSCYDLGKIDIDRIITEIG